MTSTRLKNLHDDVARHPDDSILLAYLRGQKLEIRARVIQHVEEEKCQVCAQKLDELARSSRVLDMLGEMRSYQYYPEFTLEDIYARMEGSAHRRIPAKTAIRGTNYSQRPRKSAVRLISVPVAFGLAILFTMTMLVFANLSSKTFNPFSSHGSMNSGHTMLTVVVPPHSTQQADVTATVMLTPSATAGAKLPQIKVCSSRDAVVQLRLVICGFGFDSVHNAMLFFYVPGQKAFWLRNIQVDKHGKFHVSWNIVDCGNMPIYIYGYEATSSTSIKVRLRITEFGRCIASATPVAIPPWLQSKFRN